MKKERKIKMKKTIMFFICSITLVFSLFIGCTKDLNTLLSKEATLEQQLENSKARLGQLTQGLGGQSDFTADELRKIRNDIESLQNTIDIIYDELQDVRRDIRWLRDREDRNTDGDTTGNTTGGSTGGSTGDTTGDTTGGSTGNTTGDTTGDTTGGSTGNTTGDTTGGSTGDTTGGSTGDTTGGYNGGGSMPEPNENGCYSNRTYCVFNPYWDKPYNYICFKNNDFKTEIPENISYLIFDEPDQDYVKCPYLSTSNVHRGFAYSCKDGCKMDPALIKIHNEYVLESI